ncbi:chorion peroxidase [Tribolium castaneum]|uniref:Chorion peroxidase-like Protein n=1 Tax=Tribolium castaneum TaxID=7070 RepID=A0A139WMA7_TRICA|nr:PREDICTED: chorion peroxidase [Tribolium castaneum]KYB29080.1 Chorion peroxidase-like Protein [Tribolium castaneum]|eukprot:XP_008201340.2 PREDICTED: chorion peroxidase [Tribolium castaneum]
MLVEIILLLICSVGSIQNLYKNVTLRNTEFSDSSPRKILCSDNSLCVPFVQCPAHVRNEIKKSCQTVTGREGVCCKTGQNLTAPEELEVHGRHHSLRMNLQTINLIARRSHEQIREIQAKEALLLSDGYLVVPGSPSYDHFKNFKLLSRNDLFQVLDLASRAMEIALATKDFKHRQGLTNQQIELGLLEQDLRTTPLGLACNIEPICPPIPVKFRRIDGACNNLLHPSWGTGMTPYARLLPPSYEDGIWIPRLSETGQPLASPRLISTTIISDSDSFNYDHTLMVMQFGQFLSHDMTQSIENSYANGSAISCCSFDGGRKRGLEERHYACMAIDIPHDDPFFSRFGQGCMNFVRSVLAPRQDCTLGYAQQMNKITHFLDGSNIYGSSPEQTGHLRSFHRGMLKIFNDFGRQMLPLSHDPDECLSKGRNAACYMSGDSRTNQMISLVALHTVFLREHNRLADELSKLNPHWDDERIFLEARRIVIAEVQVITYKEFLPIVIGPAAVEEFHLALAQGLDYAQDYDGSVEPSVTNEFASAAFRFGHSVVDGLLKIYGKDRMDEMISIPETMFQPSRMRKLFFMDELLSTLTTEPLQQVDNNLVEALTRYMFRAGNAFGIDLASLNIQRGRDHGLRPYNDYRELVGLPRLSHFEELSFELGEKLKSVYASVNDIDLWVGGLLEEKAPGSIVGYTFRDIIADQFYRLKKGDKYFFENDPSVNPGFFQPEQLFEVRKASMSRLICDNSDGTLLSRQAPNAFKKPGVKGNEFVDCDGGEIPRINLLYWRE